MKTRFYLIALATMTAFGLILTEPSSAQSSTDGKPQHKCPGNNPQAKCVTLETPPAKPPLSKKDQVPKKEASLESRHNLFGSFVVSNSPGYIEIDHANRSALQRLKNVDHNWSEYYSGESNKSETDGFFRIGAEGRVIQGTQQLRYEVAAGNGEELSLDYRGALAAPDVKEHLPIVHANLRYESREPDEREQLYGIFYDPTPTVTGNRNQLEVQVGGGLMRPNGRESLTAGVMGTYIDTEKLEYKGADIVLSPLSETPRLESKRFRAGVYANYQNDFHDEALNITCHWFPIGKQFDDEISITGSYVNYPPILPPIPTANGAYPYSGTLVLTTSETGSTSTLEDEIGCGVDLEKQIGESGDFSVALGARVVNDIGNKFSQDQGRTGVSVGFRANDRRIVREIQGLIGR